jgi:hypothetical protein
MPSLIYKLSFDRYGGACCALAALLLFFVLYSAPHRVHHAFEQGPLAPVAHAQDAATSERRGHEHDHEPTPSQPTDCAAQLAAQNTHFASPPLIEISLSTIGRMRSDRPPSLCAASFNPSPFSQRAPPLV